jgi:hypothetical protein
MTEASKAPCAIKGASRTDSRTGLKLVKDDGFNKDDALKVSAITKEM